MSGVHRMAQHRSAVRVIEARTLASDRSFPRHSHGQLGIGVILSGAHRSWSGIGHVEAHAGDIIMVNPGEMHDGMPIGGVRGHSVWSSAHNWFGVVVMMVKLRILSPAVERQVSHNPAMPISRRSASAIA